MTSNRTVSVVWPAGRAPAQSPHRARAVTVISCVLVAWAVAAPVNGAPVTWEYLGAVDSSPDETVLPRGTPVIFRVTADPAANYLDTLPNSSFPDNAGLYFGDLDVEFTGLQYHLRMALEVNFDPVLSFPRPGVIIMREFGWTGPPLFGHPVDPFTQCGSDSNFVAPSLPEPISHLPRSTCRSHPFGFLIRYQVRWRS